MAEPAPVYDPEDEEPVVRPVLGAIEGGGETTPPKKGHLHSAGNDETKASSPEELKHAETEGRSGAKGKVSGKEKSLAEQPAADQVGRGLVDEPSGKFSRARQVLVEQRKKAFIGGGVAIGIVTIIIAFFAALLPLKIIHIVENLQSRFFGPTHSAIEKRVDIYFTRYMKKYVLKGMQGTGVCRSTRTIDRNCIAPITESTRLQQLFQGWKDNSLETKLADRYGMEFSRNTDGSYNMKIRGSPDVKFSGEELLDVDKGFENLADSSQARNKIKAAIDESLEGTTYFKRVLHRFKVSRLLERKYGVRLCTFFCKAQDATNKWRDWKTAKRVAAQKIIIDRVIVPHTEIAGYAMGCLLDPDCSKAVSEGDNDKTEAKIRQYLQKRGDEAVSQDVGKILEAAANISENGLRHYLIEKFTNETIAKFADKGIPAIGWVNAAATAVNAIANAGTNLRKYAFQINATAMITYAMLFRTNADEIKMGQVDPELAGSMAELLGSKAGAPRKPGEPDHSGQPAESSPLYADLLGSSSASDKTSFLDIFSPTAYAEATDPNAGPKAQKYTCDNNKPIPQNQLICPEESLIANNFLTDISDAFNEDGSLNTLKQITDTWNGSVGEVYEVINDVVGGIFEITGLNSVLDALTSQIEPLLNDAFKWLVNQVIPNPISENQSGARGFNMLAGGEDASASAYGEDGAGGTTLTPGQVADIRNEQENKEQEQFNNKSFFAKIFDTESSRSLVSKMAMDIPTDTLVASQNSATTLISNPFSKILSGFGTVFSSRKAYAATIKEDPFGIPQKGYALGDPVLEANPDIYTEDYCQQKQQEWEDSVTTNLLTGQLEHTISNPCKLEDASIGAAGGYFTTNVLNQEDLGDNFGTQGDSTNGGLGVGADGFVFPQKTTKSKVTSHNPKWCYESQTNCHHDYNAADIFADPGTPVVAAKPGTVVSAKNGGPPGGGHTVGSRVTIKGDDGYVYYYAHLGYNTLKVSDGQHVNAGDVLGDVGTDHDAEDTSAHTHFDILPPSFSYRPGCSNAACQSYPFVNVQPLLINAFANLPE